MTVRTEDDVAHEIVIYEGRTDKPVGTLCNVLGGLQNFGSPDYKLARLRWPLSSLREEPATCLMCIGL